MDVLRGSVKETRRSLGINLPTAFTVVLGIAVSIAIASKLPDPETGSVSGFALWSIKTAGWIVTIGFVFVPLLVWNYAKAVRQRKSLEAQLALAAESSASMDERVKSFLRMAIKDPQYGAYKCYAFGSVVGHYPTRDVDIAIQFDSSNHARVRGCMDRLREMQQGFRDVFGLPLHLELFLYAEHQAIDEFLRDAGMHELIFDRK